jgi:hypothetical protein
MSAMARTRIGRAPLGAAPSIAVAPPLQPARSIAAAILPATDVPSEPVSTPSMRGLEATIAIASLASAILLGLLR